MTDALPDEVVDEATRLTRAARSATDPAEAEAARERRAALLAEHGFEARVREDESEAILVCHPTEWLVDGEIRMNAIEDTDRAVERSLSGPGDDADWATVESHNRDLAEDVADVHGTVHGANAHALADFASNHYAKRISDLTDDELREFEDEYFPRNAWPSPAQSAALRDSLQIVAAMAEEPMPVELDQRSDHD